MKSIRTLGVTALVVALMTIDAPAVSDLTDSDVNICLAVAKQQARMYDAKIKSDWRVMYNLLTDDYRKRTTYGEFVTNPHIDPDKRPKNISGAKTSTAAGKKSFLPPHLGYRLTDFYISEDKKMVKVVAKARLTAPQLIGPVTKNSPDEEFWIKTGPGWKAQWDTKYLIHASGAATSPKTPKLPNFTTHVKAADLARRFVEEARKLPNGEKRNGLLEKAVVVDVFSVVETIKKTDAEALAAKPFVIKQINRQMLANPISSMYFEQMMEAGRWTAIAGDHESSYQNYWMARGLDPFKEETQAALADEALRLGRPDDAAGHYVDLLKLVSITNSRHTTLLEQQIEKKCAICKQLTADKKIDIAKNLTNAQKWKPAYILFNRLLKESVSWHKTTAKLEAGKTVKTGEALGEKIADVAGQYTFDELKSLLRAGGINLYHPGDIPIKISGIKGSLTIESVPKVQRAIYKKFYKMGWLPAKALIKWNGMESSRETTTHGGYLAVILKKSSATVKKFYPDAVPDAAGNEQLIKDIKKLKRGESIILARVSVSNVVMEHFLIGALATIGVDAGLLQGSIGAQIIIGTKGMEIGGAKVYSGKHALRKVFTPPNMVDTKMMKGPAITVTGSGENATVKYIAPGR